jgi:formate--tetrahydrofolate ligase
VKKIAREIYGADDIIAPTKLRDRFHRFEEEGYGDLPICMAKTQYSLSTDPALKGRPHNFDIPLRDVELRAGAGFLLVLTGNIMTMPGLPRRPAAEGIDLDAEGKIVGLF